ncbi:penicillin-binding protein, partial [bacterium]|nr:penicillin-binding protein [bacterium]
KKFINKILFYLKPKNFFRYWFSRNGFFMFLKVSGVCLLLLLLLIGGLFAYFRKDLNAISPGEISKRVQSTINTYYDRNGEIIYEDKGSGNYKLVVESNELNKNLKNATIAIEDQNFYKHAGISITGTVRALINNLTGGSVQGGSTLTQQLVKQVFFSDQTSNRGLGGIPRKIKELILAIEVERMYNKDQILTLYLNESPYGGRRNGAESGAQTYFGKSAKDLNIAEASLLAAIPQNPSLYDPYNTAGNDYLITRQHRVIDNMLDQKMISKTEADEAKKVPILDQLKPLASQYAGVKAPHFIQMVKAELKDKIGATVLGRGGLKITTTLDLRIQEKLNSSFVEMFNSNTPIVGGFSNGAATVEDVKTGQIIALEGSRDFSYEGFGQDNTAESYIQPGSTIKPFVYAKLFTQQPSGSLNFGSGSILKDENIDAIYGGKVNNWDKKFMGDITTRTGLGASRNIPAIKAMYINGVQNTISTIREMGASSYCSQGNDRTVGLAAAIGGCGVRQIDLVNAYSTLARGGIMFKQSSVIEVKSANGESLYQWQSESKKVIDAQATYIVSDILNDADARSSLVSRSQRGYIIKDVPTGTKTGTTDLNGFAKDIWMMSYSPVIAMGVWFGNNDTRYLKAASSSMPGPIVDSVMSYAHKEIYAKDGRWKINDWFTAPSGIQKVGKEVYPSWWSANQGQTNAQLVMDKFSKKKATQCTPENAKITLDVKKMIDPITKKDTFIAPDGYDGNSEDDKHSCSDTLPSVVVAKPI